MTRKCSKCGEVKPLTEFYSRKDRASGLSSWCRRCYASRSKRRRLDLQRVEMDKNTHAAWLKSNKEKVAETQRKYQAEWKGSTSQKWSSFKSGIKQRYGLSVEDFQGYLDKQNNRCPICGMCLDECIRHVDHCHKTGEVRGILCFKCNIGLGNFYDSVPNLLGAIKYLQLFEGVLNETETEVPFE